MDDERPGLYQQMADLTNPECGDSCWYQWNKVHTVAKGHCCDAMYCKFSQEWAKEKYGIDLPETQYYLDGKTDLPMMNETGCSVAPHLRPVCTVHVCHIANFGYKPNDPDWTDKYFALRDQINEEEIKHNANS